jgi:hypothetical protein
MISTGIHQLMNGKRECVIYTMENYSAINKNENMLFAGRWIELESIMLSEISQTVFSHM